MAPTSLLSLEGPEKYHAFISHDYNSEPAVALAQEIATMLRSKAFHIKLKQRTLNNSSLTKEDCHLTSAMEDPAEVIGRSLKVIILATDSYIQEPDVYNEAKMAILYAEELGEPRRILVVWDDGVDANTESLPADLKLTCYRSLQYGRSADFSTQLQDFVVSGTYHLTYRF